MFHHKKSSLFRNRFAVERQHNSSAAIRGRSPSPIPIFRRQADNGIHIITDESATTPQLSASASPNHPNHYEKVFITLYIQGEVKIHSARMQRDFCLDDSFASLLPEDYRHEDTTNGRCICCLCKLRHRCNDIEICIENHPSEKPCTVNDQEMRVKNTMWKYQKKHVCDECMDSLTSHTKKTKSGTFRCRFIPCPIRIKSKVSLRKHYLEHLKVKNFICSICEKDYKSKSGLKKHERTHINDRNIR